MLRTIDNPLASCDLKFDQGGKKGTFEGYASVFGGVDSYGDTIVKGAYAATLENRSRLPMMFFGHRSDQVPGKWLEMREDDIGLYCVGEFTPNHTEAANHYASLKHGAVDGLSVGINVPAGGSEETPEGIRILKNVDLIEVSIVSLPADQAARVAIAKGEIETIDSLRSAELFLRDSGDFSRATATCFVSRIKEIARSDSDAELLEKIAGLELQLNAKSFEDSVVELFQKHPIKG